MIEFIPLSDLLNHYKTNRPEERDFKERFIDLIRHERAFYRDHLPGHITGSGWVVNSTRTKVLLHHHKKLDKWLQPGGHADGDKNVLNVALRELEEETGIRNVKQLGSGIFDLDIHTIPARKDFPEHLHYDVRFCFEASEFEPIQVSDESLDVQWKSWDDLRKYSPGNSLIRMMEKSMKL